MSQETGFDDQGQPVPVYRPPARPPALELVDTLTEIGAMKADLSDAIRAKAALEIELAFDRAGDERGAEALSMILARVGGGRRGAELRAALLSGLDGSISPNHAKEFGISRQTWFTNVKRLRRKLLCQENV